MKFAKIIVIYLMFCQNNSTNAHNCRKYDSLKCIDIKLNIMNYYLSLYNLAYFFVSKNNDTIIINRKCNYSTTGIYYERHEMSIYHLFGFMKDSIYSLQLSEPFHDCDYCKNLQFADYYCYVKFDTSGSFYPKTFKRKLACTNGIHFNMYSNFVDINNTRYLLTDVFPYHHTPPDNLLPDKIYPYYIMQKNKYIINKKYIKSKSYKSNRKLFKYVNDNFYRIIEATDNNLNVEEYISSKRLCSILIYPKTTFYEIEIKIPKLK